MTSGEPGGQARAGTGSDAGVGAVGRPAPETSVLLGQYQVVAQHHIHFMGLIWQVPALAGAMGGTLVAFTYARDMPGIVRVLVLAIATVVSIVMTVALERYRMFQLRRRRDLEDIERDLLARGGRGIVWHGSSILAEIRRGELPIRRTPFMRWEGFTALRVMMYLVTLLVLAACLMAAAETLGLLRLR
jgi:hypothetical protein